MPDKNTRSAKKLPAGFLISCFIGVVALGWKYPALGYVVPLVMGTGAVFGFFRGRYVCGNVCPRGTFLGNILPRLWRAKPIPGFMFHAPLRWSIFGLLMGFMLFRLWKGPRTFENIGLIFWQMCVITSAIAVVLAAIWSPRSWCAFCPMGTLQMTLGGGKYFPELNSELCRKCLICEKACPLNLPIVEQAPDKRKKDCMSCGKCVHACPVKALK